MDEKIPPLTFGEQIRRSRAKAASSRNRIALSEERIKESNRLVAHASSGFGIPAEPLSDAEVVILTEARQACVEQRQIEDEVRETNKNGSAWRRRPFL